MAKKTELGKVRRDLLKEFEDAVNEATTELARNVELWEDKMQDQKAQASVNFESIIKQKDEKILLLQKALTQLESTHQKDSNREQELLRQINKLQESLRISESRREFLETTIEYVRKRNQYLEKTTCEPEIIKEEGQSEDVSANVSADNGANSTPENTETACTNSPGFMTLRLASPVKPISISDDEDNGDTDSTFQPTNCSLISTLRNGTTYKPADKRNSSTPWVRTITAKTSTTSGVAGECAGSTSRSCKRLVSLMDRHSLMNQEHAAERDFVHEGTRMYVCRCGRGFLSLEKRNGHIYDNTRMCELCSFGPTTSQDLKIHMEQCHKGN